MQTPLSKKVVQPLEHIEVYRYERECKNNVLSISVKPQLSGTCGTIHYYTWNCADFPMHQLIFKDQMVLQIENYISTGVI